MAENSGGGTKLYHLIVWGIMLVAAVWALSSFGIIHLPHPS